MILYLSPGCNPELFADGIEKQRFSSGMQVQRFNSLVIRGLSLYTTISALGHLPYANDQSAESDDSMINDGPLPWYSLKNHHSRWGKIKRFIALLNKGLSISRHHSITAVIADAVSPLYALCALIIAKRVGCTSVGIVTDLPMYMFREKRSFRASITQLIISRFDNYILLSQPMDAVVNTHHRPFIIMEGICEYEETPIPQKKSHNTIKIVYAGSIDDGNGIRNLLNAFVALNAENAELIIYGSGPLSGLVVDFANKNVHIKYGGVLDASRMREALYDADVLINPRPVGLDFVAYSFPSKMMDYMSSGTVTMCTRLSCIPEEYFSHLYAIEDDTIEGLTESLKSIINLPSDKRQTIGIGARKFVIENKNHIVQGKRIFDMIVNGR